MTAEDQLTGWKDIARYLGVEVRTAQRYVGRGLPLRRNEHARGGVYVVKAELQAWRDGLQAARGHTAAPRVTLHALLTLTEALEPGRYVVSIGVSDTADSSAPMTAASCVS